jgi:two-component system, chemotaxis family, protein-glutamate methylesterase/glutaminase
MPVVYSPCLRIVAIGASAGGVPLLQRLVAGLPGDFAPSVLVVLHMHPTVPSRLPWLLGRHAALPVRSAAEGQTIEAGTIYVAVPNLHLLTGDGRIELLPSMPVHHVRPSIDRLFMSMAGAYGRTCAAVVLSGTGVDGAEGVVAVRRAGGTTIAQDPTEAAYAGMPMAAVRTGCVDHVVGVAAIAPLLARLAGSAAGASA